MSMCFFIAISGYTGRTQNSLPYFGQTPPDSIPERFGPAFLLTDNTWSWYGGPVFSPDGKEMFFGKYHLNLSSGNVKMYYVQDINGVWTMPQIAPFSGTASLSSPNYSSDGNKLFFNADYSSIDLTMIYYVNRIANAWSTPVLINMPYPALPEMISGTSMTHDSTFYFTLHTAQGAYIYKSECINGQYNSFERLPNQINLYNSSSVYVDPEEEYILFNSNRPGTYGEDDLYVCFKKPDGGWTSAINLGSNINGPTGDYNPSISADGKYLFFQSQRTGDINANTYWVDAGIIEQLNPYSGLDPRISIRGVELLQNYPNPCNANTIIAFVLEKPMLISMEVYNQSGIKVMDLIKNQMYQKGKCTFLMDVSKLPSGIYTYSLILESGERVSKRMIVFNP